MEKRARHALKLVGMDEKFYKQSPFELSGGQKRRVAIAGVLAMRPEMMILDEPTAGLDPQGRDEILGQIERLNREHGLTILVVSHSMEDMARYVDRIMVMNDGVKMFDDTPKEVFRHYKELEAIGLAAPQITYVVQGLRERGIPIDDAITTVEEARRRFWRCITSGGRNNDTGYHNRTVLSGRISGSPAGSAYQAVWNADLHYFIIFRG